MSFFAIKLTNNEYKKTAYWTASLLYKYQVIARKLLSSRACYSSFGRSKINQFSDKKPTIFGHTTIKKEAALLRQPLLFTSSYI